MKRLGLLSALMLGGCVQSLPVFESDGGVDAGRDGGVSVGVSHVATGQGHTCAVKTGALFCWGDNTSGQLGTGDQNERNAPVQVGTETDWVQVENGYSSTCARKSNGTVWCWGDDSLGQLGNGSAGSSNTPVQVPLGFATQTLHLHFEHACVIDPDAGLWCWGKNDEGDLGLNDGYPGMNQTSPVQVSPGAAWIDVDLGQGHACGLRADHSLWCWGRNTGGHLGLPDAGQQIRVPTQVGTETTWLTLALTQNSSCALKQDHSLWCWGYDFLEPIGNNTYVTSPERIGFDSDWSQIAIETFQACGQKTSGAIWCWGRNNEYQLGTGDQNDVYTPGPIESGHWQTGSVGRMFRCAIDLDGGLYCTGDNRSGEGGAGVSDDFLHVLTPVVFP